MQTAFLLHAGKGLYSLFKAGSYTNDISIRLNSFHAIKQALIML